MNSGGRTRRPQRMAMLVRAELSRLFLQEVSDPGVCTLTIRHVEMTGDLKLAKVYLDCGGNAKPAFLALKRATPFLRRRLGEALELRYTPDLKFFEDEAGESMLRIAEILEHPTEAKTEALS